MKKTIIALAIVAASVSAFAGDANTHPVISGYSGNERTVDIDPVDLTNTNDEFQETVFDVTIRVRKPMPGYKYTVCPEFGGFMVGDASVDVSPKKSGDVLARFYRDDGKTPFTPSNCWVTDTPQKPMTVKLTVTPSKGFVGELNFGGVRFEARPVLAK